MLIQQPPFALHLPVFRFRGLAAQAGRAALGGDREIVLACFMVARLGAGMLPPVALADGDTATRAASARNWLASLTLPGPLRAAAVAAIDAVGTGDRGTSARAIASLADAAGAQLDPPSVEEMMDLADELSASRAVEHAPPLHSKI